VIAAVVMMIKKVPRAEPPNDWRQSASQKKNDDKAKDQQMGSAYSNHAAHSTAHEKASSGTG
jgi:hypothetical protein